MSWEYSHLITHAFPVVLSVAAVFVGLAGWILGREDLERWGIVALLIAGAFAIPAYITGLAAADVVAERTFVYPSVVQSHRGAATWALVPLLLVAVLAGFSAVQPADGRLRRFVLLVGLLAAATTGYAAFLGSRIEHGPTQEEPGSDRTRSDQTSEHNESGALAGLALAACCGLVSATAGTPGGRSVQERAERLHREALVVDGHNDLPWRIRGIWGLDLDRVELDRRQDEGHTDLVRLREGGVDVQFWAAYVPVRFTGPAAPVVAREQIDLIKRLAARYPDDLEMVYTADEIERAVARGRVASLIGIEGGHAIDNSLEILRELYQLGARYMTLTHAATLDWVDAAGDDVRHGGLTDFGREVVREMNRLGMLVDLSHVTADVMRAALAVSDAPIIFSHSSARALADHPRNVPDDVLRLVAENRGIVMVNFYSGFLTEEGAALTRDLFADEKRLRRENPDPDDLQQAMEQWLVDHPTPPGNVGTIADHIDHVVGVAGIDHVGLGSDFDGIPMAPEGMEDVSKYPALTVELLRRGYSEEDVRKVLGANFLRVLREVEASSGGPGPRSGQGGDR